MLLADFLLLLTALLAVAVAIIRACVAGEEGELANERLAERESSVEEDDALAAIGLMTGDLCEEVIPPVTVILAQCELLRAAGEEESPRLRTIEAQARRIARVIERHRGFSPASSGSPRPVDLRQLAQEVVRDLAPLAHERGVALHPIFEDVPPVSANPLLLKRAMRQMVRTAIRASGDSGVGDVTVALGELGDPDGAAGFCVADDGPGMDENQRRRALEPLDAAHADLRGTRGGFSLVQAIAGAMGALLVLDSEPGAGTRATLKLPIAAKKSVGGLERPPTSNIRGWVGAPTHQQC